MTCAPSRSLPVRDRDSCGPSPGSRANGGATLPPCASRPVRPRSPARSWTAVVSTTPCTASSMSWASRTPPPTSRAARTHCGCTCPPRVSPGTSILFTDVRVFASSGSEPFDGEVLVRGERITDVRRGSGDLPREGVRVVDGGGQFLRSGLRDAHRDRRHRGRTRRRHHRVRRRPRGDAQAGPPQRRPRCRPGQAEHVGRGDHRQQARRGQRLLRRGGPGRHHRSPPPGSSGVPTRARSGQRGRRDRDGPWQRQETCQLWFRPPLLSQRASVVPWVVELPGTSMTRPAARFLRAKAELAGSV